jgi:phosphoserine phosphatase RsbU/P
MPALVALLLSPELASLRLEFPAIVGSVILLLVGLTAGALFLFRRKTRELTLIYFGLFCCMYALRLLANLRTIRSLFSFSSAFWIYFDWTITATIILPFGLFLYQIVDERTRQFFRWLIGTQAAVGVFGIAVAFAGVPVPKLHVMNNFVVLGTLAAIGMFVFSVYGLPRKSLSREMRVLIFGFLVWVAFVVHANLLGLGLAPGRNVEFIGFLVLVGSLGYVSAQRIFANEERLLAINKELEIARQIQSSILPREIPRMPGLDIAARYVPISAVAGDFYDFLPLDGQRLGVLVADVTGHGVPAALIASMLKVAFAGQSQHADDPARILSGLNRALCGKFEEHFVTAGYAFVDCAAARLRYAGAGHPPLLITRQSNSQVEEIEENGVMLGLFPEATYETREISFKPGDRCVLYTDGILESGNATREEFGRSRLKKFLETHRQIPAGRLTDDLLAELARWSNGAGGASRPTHDDDITLLVVDFHGTA